MTNKLVCGILLILLFITSGCNSPKPAPKVVSAKEGFTVQESSLIEKAKQDLAKRLNIPADQISVRSMESVEWPDTSLGCPEEGKMYAQVVLPGYKILLEAKGKVYEYHAGGKDVVFCKKR